MEAFAYEDSPYAIRSDIGDAHRTYWARLASPGSWWSGADRVSIAAECRAARNCSFCADRKLALSPYTAEERHETVSDLPAVAVDAVHRIVTDQTRITREWIEQNNVSGLTLAAYVELAGIVVAILSIDEFHCALGLPLESLPIPQAGDPDGYQPENLSTETGFVPMIARDGAVGSEADLWPSGFGANVIPALSLVPDAVRAWKDLSAAQYLAMEGMDNFVGQEDRAIDRAQMEIVAGRVSSHNECFY